jgi:hypothetical protein
MSARVAQNRRPSQFRLLVLVWLAGLAQQCFPAVDAVTNRIPKELFDPSTQWGPETNGLCAGLSTHVISRGDLRMMDVIVMVVTSRTNAEWNYMSLPDRKISRIELRFPDGKIVAPRRGAKTSAYLPERIQAKDLQWSHDGKMYLKDWLLLSRGAPLVLGRFSVQDLFRIEKEGDYTLSVCPVIYEFAADRKSVSRIDLPCVTTSVHLAPQEK